MVEKGKRVMHHDDPPCTARLDDGFCNKCNVLPDMQSLAIYLYCPKCDCVLIKLECPKCKKFFCW